MGIDRGECGNGGPGAGLDRGQFGGSLRTAKDQPVISPVENLDRGQLGGAGLVEGGDTLHT